MTPPLLTARGILVAPTSMLEPINEGVYVLTLRLDAAAANRMPVIDGYDPSWSADRSNADFTFKTHGFEWFSQQRRQHEPPPVFDVRARLCKNLTHEFVSGSVVRVSFQPRGFALVNSAAYFGFVPCDALHLSAVQV